MSWEERSVQVFTLLFMMVAVVILHEEQFVAGMFFLLFGMIIWVLQDIILRKPSEARK